MLTKEEYYRALLKGCKLWKHVLYIHTISTNIAGERVSSKLCDHFKNANEFLIRKMSEMGEHEML